MESLHLFPQGAARTYFTVGDGRGCLRSALCLDCYAALYRHIHGIAQHVGRFGPNRRHANNTVWGACGVPVHVSVAIKVGARGGLMGSMRCTAV